MEKITRIHKGTIAAYFMTAFMCLSFNTWSQVGVGTSNPDASAALEIQSTTKGLLLPRMTGLQMNNIASPAEGLLVYCTNCTPKGLYYYNGTAFVSSVSATESGSEGVTEIFSATGKIWMDRNIGASQVATSSTDHLAYGSLFQWGRGADGHEVINWTSSTSSDGTEQSRETSTLSSTDTPGHDDFILTAGNWRTTVNTNLWQGVSGINNPCPSGFRLPTNTEWNAERLAFPTNDAAGAFAALKLTMSGFRRASTGALADIGTTGLYLASTLNVFDNGQRLTVTSGNVSAGSASSIGTGASVRCMKD